MERTASIPASVVLCSGNRNDNFLYAIAWKLLIFDDDDKESPKKI
jgi:hypothetical protein